MNTPAGLFDFNAYKSISLNESIFVSTFFKIWIKIS